MEAVYSKIKDMLKAFYPVLYLTSFEYDRTKQKIEGIINVLRSEGKDVRIFNWNCVDGLRGLNGDKPQPVINKDGEEIEGDVLDLLTYVWLTYQYVADGLDVSVEKVHELVGQAMKDLNK